MQPNQQDPYQYTQPPAPQPQNTFQPQAQVQPQFPVQPQPISPYMAPVFSSNERALRSANRRRLAMLIIAGLLLLGGSASGIWLIVSNHKDSGISNQVASVTIATGGFTPATVTVQKGQEVTITNTDTTSHRLTADQIALPNFDSVDLLSQGDSYTYTFEKAGTYHYYDPADPAGFTGTINVK